MALGVASSGLAALRAESFRAVRAAGTEPGAARGCCERPQQPAGPITALTANDVSPTFTWTTVSTDSYEVWVNDNGKQIYDVMVTTGNTWTPPSPLTIGHGFSW